MIQLNETYHGSKDMNFQCFLDMLQTLFEEKYLDAKEVSFLDYVNVSLIVLYYNYSTY